MYPLLVKDGLILPYFVFFVMLVSISVLLLKRMRNKIAIGLLSLTILGLTFVWHFTTPPVRFPDLYTLFIMDFSFVGFLLFYFYFSWLQFNLPSHKPITIINQERKIQ
jgi:hypothetical protein